MATVVDPSKNLIKLDNGQTVSAQTGGWYDGMQYWGGTLSQPGQINPQSNQPGAGELVSNEVIAQTNPANVQYIAEQRARYGLTPSPATGVPIASNVPTSTGTAGAGVNLPAFTPQAPINLPDIYKGLYASSGIDAMQTDLTNKEKQYLEAKSKISDNPFLSASMVDKRLARLDAKYATETKPIQDQIAMKKADIETQLNLQTKQFDINSQSAKDALAYFNTLLDAGALDGASGQDIANLTTSTGLSSSLIQSAIQSRKTTADKTQVITSTADDGTVTATVINAQTGEIIKQNNLGRVGNAQTGSSSASQSEQVNQIYQDVQARAKRGVTWDQLYNDTVGIDGVDPMKVYQIYLGANYYKIQGNTKVIQGDLQRYGLSTTNFQTIIPGVNG